MANVIANTNRIKVPGRASNSKVDKKLATVPRDGQWHELLEMGETTAEQTARSYNVPGGNFEFGYSVESKDGELVSILWVRSV